MDLVSVITPCYKSEAHIARAARSVLAQSYKNWELIVISDDGEDYEKILADAGIKDSRIRHTSTGQTGAGPGAARNAGIDAARGDIIALLDSDDEFMPEKLKICAPAAAQHGMVTCALEIRNENGIILRKAGNGGSDGILKAGDYKLVNISGHTMLTLDRKKISTRYADGALEDLDFILRCFEYVDHFFHYAAPLQRYYKVTNSLSHSENTEHEYTSAKNAILRKLREDGYKFKNPDMKQDMLSFLELSVMAEGVYWEKTKNNPEILFEDVFEETLAKNATRAR